MRLQGEATRRGCSSRIRPLGERDRFPGVITAPVVRRLTLVRDRGTDLAALALWHGPDDLPDDLASALALHPDEIERLQGMRHAGRRRDFALGRHVARCAVSSLAGAHATRDSPIAVGVFGQPVLGGPAAPHLDVSLGHADGLVAAVAFPRSHPLGLDVEGLDFGRAATMMAHISTRERELLGGLELDELEMLTRLWTAKEALSKALRTGLTLPLELYEAMSAERDGERVRFTFTTFRQYAAETLAGRTHCLALCLPRRTRCDLDSGLLRAADVADSQ